MAPGWQESAAAETGSNLSQQVLLEVALGEILIEIDPAAVLADVDIRLDGAKHAERNALWGVVGMLGDEGAKQFAIKQSGFNEFRDQTAGYTACR